MCLVAEHCWDPVGLAIVEYAYRFERLAAAKAPRTVGGIDGTKAPTSAARRGQAPQPRSGAPQAPGLTAARPAEPD